MRRRKPMYGLVLKIVVQVKLLLDAVQVSALAATLHGCNESADWVSRIAFERRVFREYALRKHTYTELKARGLGAQAAQHVIKKVADAYAARCTRPSGPGTWAGLVRSAG